MKLRIADRIIAALTGIILIACCVALVATVFFGVGIPEKATALLADTSLKVRGLVLLAGAVAALLGIYNILVLFRHRRRCDKFVTVKTEDGEITIAGKTIENMITRCTDQHDELSVSSVKLKNEKNGLHITLRGKVAGGVSIPLTISALQKQIRQYVTACSGLEVNEILFQIDGPGNDAETAAYIVDTPVIALQSGTPETGRLQSDPAPVQGNIAVPEYPVKTETTSIPDEVQEDDRPLHQRIFCTPDEPCIVPPPPADDNDKASADDPETDETPVTEEECDAEPVVTSCEMSEAPEIEETERADEQEHEDPLADKAENETTAEEKIIKEDGFVEAQKLFDSMLTNGQPE